MSSPTPPAWLEGARADGRGAIPWWRQELAAQFCAAWWLDAVGDARGAQDYYGHCLITYDHHFRPRGEPELFPAWERETPTVVWQAGDPELPGARLSERRGPQP